MDGRVQRVIYAGHGHARAVVVERPDGLFHLLEETLEHDDEGDVSHWTTPMFPLRGIYDSSESAEREVRSWPSYRPTDERGG